MTGEVVTVLIGEIVEVTDSVHEEVHLDRDYEDYSNYYVNKYNNQYGETIMV